LLVLLHYQRRQLTIRVFPLEGDKNKIEATVDSAIVYPFGSKGIVKVTTRSCDLSGRDLSRSDDEPKG